MQKTLSASSPAPGASPLQTPSFTQQPAAAPFCSAEEAWFWFIRCLRARRDGARFQNSNNGSARPCEPDDLYLAVMRLFISRRIGKEHLQVLEAFGLRETPPDPRRQEEQRAARLWDMALDRLETILKSKGIVRCDNGHGPQEPEPRWDQNLADQPSGACDNVHYRDL